MRYAFLAESYSTERVKVVSVWSEFGTTIFPFGREKWIRADAACMSRWCISA